MQMPTRDELDAIERGDAHPSIFSRTIGDYRVSAVYRKSSAAYAPGWYVETMSFPDGDPVYQGEG